MSDTLTTTDHSGSAADRSAVLDITTSTATVPKRSVPTRRINLEPTFVDLPKHFAVDGDIVLSHFAASLSSVFPDGEDYFVRSVRHYRDQITDPELRRQVKGFIGQEATHGREHRRLNDRLAELGYPTKFNERLTRRMLTFREKVAPPISNLAATAALEHFTASLAELLMSDEEARSLFGDPAMHDIFLWHALEESEHKAVAFDVYKAVGGSERMRVWTMVALRYGFIIGMGVQTAASLAGDRETYRKGVLRASLGRFRRSPLVSKKLWRQLKEYDAADFHPDDRDTTALMEEWHERFFGEDGTLNEQLITSASTR